MVDGNQIQEGLGPGSVFTYDLEPGQQPSHGVVAAVSAVAGAAPVAPASDEPDEPVLEPLYETIDPDALDAMFSSTGTGRREGRVTFTYHGLRVSAGSDGRITVRRSRDPDAGEAD